jgi:hypothetical protein
MIHIPDNLFLRPHHRCALETLAARYENSPEVLAVVVGGSIARAKIAWLFVTGKFLMALRIIPAAISTPSLWMRRFCATPRITAANQRGTPLWRHFRFFHICMIYTCY